MIEIALPDGSKKQFDNPVTVFQVAEGIGAGLAKAALAGEVDGQLVDTSFVIDKSAKIRIITERDKEGLEVIRHSAAHLLAQAVKQLFPTVQVTIGPVIEDGFYYDFSYERPFTPEDLAAIEQRMKELVKQDLPVSRSEITRDDAVKYFRDLKENYKAEIIEGIPATEKLSLYKQGDFVDLCRGPHVPRTGRIKAFKLTKLAGAYWRGDSKNEMLQRIYGTAWASKDDLEQYLKRIEEAEKRDHRKIAKALDLFHLQEEAPGMIFWHAKGWTVYQIVEQYIRDHLKRNNYKEIRTPQILDRSLWEKSGHWQIFGKEMFFTHSENRDFAIKPMSCPCHVEVFKHGFYSYRDLPLRFAEFGNCHRNETSGSMHGLMRVRNMVQDDGHIFCTEDQIESEVSDFITLLYDVYADFGFNEVKLRLATRPDDRIGDDASWDKAERDLAQAMEKKGLTFEVAKGEGAFYGPKIEFHLKDCIGRVWQCGTMQIDFSMPGRLGAQYVTEDNSRQAPVMLHRAILGSFERFLGILIEHYAGNFPVWLAPVQVAVMNITDKQAAYTEDFVKKLQNLGFRVIMDLRNEKVGFKIREHTLQKIPYLVVIGDREVETNNVAIRTRRGEDLGAMSQEKFIELMRSQIEKRGRFLEE